MYNANEIQEFNLANDIALLMAVYHKDKFDTLPETKANQKRRIQEAYEKVSQLEALIYALYSKDSE